MSKLSQDCQTTSPVTLIGLMKKYIAHYTTSKSCRMKCQQNMLGNMTCPVLLYILMSLSARGTCVTVINQGNLASCNNFCPTKTLI